MNKPSDHYGDFPYTKDKGKHLHRLRTFEEQVEYHLWLLKSLKHGNHQYPCYRVTARDVMLKLNKLLDLYEEDTVSTKTSNAAEEWNPNYLEHHETKTE